MPKRAQLGMAMFLISEAVLFFLLILAFAYFRAIPSALTPLEGLVTALLLVSTLSMWRATSGPRLWLWVTLALGVAFLAGQATFYGTTFFTLVGVHGLHILGGVIALAIVPSTALRVLSLYWYFFTAVWLAIVLIVYVRSAA